MGLRPTQGDENGFCSATALHGCVALSFVIPERTRISCCAAIDRGACAASVKSSTGVADPRDMKRGISCPRQKCNKSPGAPSPRISCKAWWGQRTSCGFPYRKPHTLPWLGPRSRKSGVLRAFCEGWDTTNLDTDSSRIPPFAKSAKDGAPAFSWCFLLCQTPTAA